MRALQAGRPIAAVLILALAAGSAFAQQAKPKRRDTNDRLKPPEVSIETSVEPATAKPGDVVTYKVTVTVEEPWHIYAFAKEQPAQGPRSTQFDFFGTAGLEPAGDWTPDRAPRREKEPAFPDLDAVEFYEGKVTWSHKLKVPAGARPGEYALQNQILFQICNDQACKPPVYWTVPPATVEVQGADEAASLPPPSEGKVGIAPEPLGPPAAAGGTADRESTTRAAETRLASFPGGESAVALLITGFQATATTPAADPNTAQGAIAQGFWSFVLFSALGGVAALLMPCVWPMVPITVNFFVKQGAAKKSGSTTGLAIIYCVSIIGIFTLLGVLFAAFVGATSLNKFANNGWVNLFIALVFFAFGLSLLGLFEIRLPSFVLNASAKNEGRGGLVGVIFMATTLVITSFTCTVPVVGGLLFLASKGNYFYPIIGMLTFSGVLALPFFILALMPGQLAKLPKSGDWMNTVKVVGGLIEIGAALKFVNVAEIGFGATPDTAWVDAQVMLGSWVVLAAICGLYLLGFFRTDHDHGEIRIGPGRMVTGAIFLFLAIYLTPALFGYPPKGRLYDTLVVGILPGDAHELSQSQELIAALPTQTATPAAGESALAQAPVEKREPVKATSDDPEVAQREEKTVHGVVWGMSLAQAKEQAKAAGRPILIDFTGVNCPNCRKMEQGVFPKPEIVDLLKKFETVQLYVDIVPIESLSPDDRAVVAEDNALFQLDLVQQSTQPYYVVIDAEGKVLAQTGYSEVSQFRQFLSGALESYDKDGERMAAVQPAASR